MSKIEIYDDFLENIPMDPEDITEEFLENVQIIIYNRMKELGISSADLSKLFMGSKGRISQILNESKDMKLSTFIKLLYFLKLKPVPYCVDMITNDTYTLTEELFNHSKNLPK